MYRVETVDKITAARLERCPHRSEEFVTYLVNESGRAVDVYINPSFKPNYISLTNQTIYVSCQDCYKKLRYRFEPDITLQ